MITIPIEKIIIDKNKFYVYGFEALNGYVKIGVSMDPARRMRELEKYPRYFGDQTSVLKLVYLFQMKDSDQAYNLENLLHSYFAEFRQRGEWFDIKPEDLGRIMSFAISFTKTCPMTIFPKQDRPKEITDLDVVRTVLESA